MVRLRLTEHPGAVSHRDLPGEHRLDEARHLLGQVLAVGVEGDDDVGPGVREQPVAGAKRGAAAAVDHVAGDDRAGGLGHIAGAVAGAVVDDQHGDRLAADLAGIRSSTWPMFSASL